MKQCDHCGCEIIAGDDVQVKDDGYTLCSKKCEEIADWMSGDGSKTIDQ